MNRAPQSFSGCRISGLVFATAAVALLCVPTGRALAGKLEAGFELGVTSDFSTVSFTQSFDTTPLVFTLPVANSTGDPGTAWRIRNVTTTGFEIAHVEPPNAATGGGGNDGTTSAAAADFFAIEPGIYNIGGLTFEAGSIDTQAFQTKTLGGTSFEKVNLNGNFGSVPTLIANVQTMKNEDSFDPNNSPPGVSLPWMTTAVQNVTQTDFELAIERAEVDGGDIDVDETIGYLAMTEGSASLGGADLDVIMTPDSVGNSQFTVNFPTVSNISLPIVVGSMMTRDGGDGGWLRITARSSDSVGVHIIEDTDDDNETNHTDEIAALLAISDPFTAEVETVPEPGTLALAAMGLLAVPYLLWRRRKR